jgi:glyoxylase-like metal-dependent hydrolase (beta-lactamase superfamily II)
MDQPKQLADGVVRLGTSKVNWYLVGDESGVTMVDSGLQGFLPQLDPGLKLLGRSREDLRAILLTHGDGDHVGVAAKLQHEGDETPIHLSPEDRKLVQGERKPMEDSLIPLLAKPGTWTLLAHFARHGEFNQPKIERTVDLEETQVLDVPGSPRVIHTPGHSDGHVVFHFPRHGALFAGDTICTWHPITGKRGPQQMAFNASNSQALDSLSRYEDLDAELLLVGHGEPWTEGPAAAVERARAAAVGLDPVSG